MADNPPKDIPADKPQFKPPPKKEPSTAPRKSPGRPPALKGQIQEFYGTIGVVLSFASPEDGQIFMQNAEAAADAWARLAAQNPSVRRTWETILTGSTWSAVVMVHMTMAYGIARNHDLVPELLNPLGDHSDNGKPPDDGYSPPGLG